MAEREKREGKRESPPRRRQRETAADRARVGTVIAASYRIDEFLGRGAIGAVFGGMHLRLERRVAVKFVDPTLVDDPEVRARFKREAKICAQIGSSHAVEVFDYGLGEDGAPFLVMERLDGEDLHQRLLREGPIPVDRALRIAKQVCRSLGAAHGNGIVHRDLKPENVFLVDRDGEKEFVKVVDFGLSTFVQSDDTRLTRAGQSVGTPLYMAPEQAGAAAFDARVDVYSLGVLIFEMTTGRLPFEAQTLQALLVALATAPPRSIRQYNPKLPIELDDLVLRFIARDPRVRPKTAAAALAEIVALEERLQKKAEAAAGQASKPGLAPDGLPGKLSSEFEGELNSHLAELRRTGRLSTSELHDTRMPDTESAQRGEPRPVNVPVGTDPIPSTVTGDTRPMERAEIDEMMSDPKLPAASPPQPVSSGPAAAPRRTKSSRPPAPMPRSSESQKRKATHAKHVSDDPDAIEEDSGLFYGRVQKGGAPGSPGPLKIQEIDRGSKKRKPRTTIPAPAAVPRKGPPMLILWIAVAAFLVVAALVAIKAMGK